jgi:hypothetical protein
MPALVNDEVDEIKEQKTGTVCEGIQQEQRIEAEPRNARAARNRFPLAEFIFKEGHWPKRNKRDLAWKAIRGKVFQ